MTTTHTHFYAVIQPDELTIERLERSTPFELEEAQKLVGGGYIELVPQVIDWAHLEEKLETGDHGVVVLCNEDGLSKGFDFNPVATSMIGINLVGPVIVCDARLFE